MAKPKQKPDNNIAINKKARHDYFILEQIEAGLVLEGWEVKSLRSKNIQLKESYVLLKNMEAWLLGAHISPLPTASTHKVANPTRTRKLLLHKNEVAKLVGAVERKGFTILCLYPCTGKKGWPKSTLGSAKANRNKISVRALKNEIGNATNKDF